MNYGQSVVEFEKINQSQGLSNSRITGIVKEKNGFIWVSTQNGLNRYDGHNIKVYQKKNSNIGSNDISDLILDHKNRIWLATLDGGLNLYDREKDDFIVYKNILKDSNSIVTNLNKILEDENGNIWLGTDKGLVCFDTHKNSFTNFSIPILNGINITSLYKDKEGNIWLGTFGKGLFLFNTKLKKIVKIKTDSRINFISVFSKLNSDNLLIGTSGNGLMVLNLQTKKITDFFKNKPLKKKIEIVRSLRTDTKDNLWIGTDGLGLFKIKHPNNPSPIITNYMYSPQLKSSLSGNAVYVIREINNKSIWIGTAWNGISILNLKPTNDLIYSDFSGKNPFPVLSTHKFKDILLFGTDGNGLSGFDQKNNKTYTFKNLKKGKYIQHISTTANEIWMGTFASGLIKYNYKNNTTTQYLSAINNLESISFNDVRDLVFDKKNNLWIATWGGGLNYFNRKKNQFYAYKHNENDNGSLSNNNVVAIEKDHKNIWVATFGGGLDLFNINTKKFTHFTYSENNTNSISSNFIFSILKDANNYLWIGTSGGGMNRMNLQNFKIERFDQFKDRTITSIIQDDHKNIWFSTKQGIIKYDYENNKFVQPQSLKGDFHINSGFKDNENNLYFGGIKGVTKFTPHQIDLSYSKPKVTFTNFKLFNKEVAVAKNGILKQNIQLQQNIILKHSDNVITFEYAGLKYPFSKDLEYAIKMENFDENWREVGFDKTATYTNLSSGNYIFKVKSKEIGDEWSSDFTSIQIKIQKPFWLSIWAILFYILLCITFFLITRKYFMAWTSLKSSLALEKLMHEKDNELYKSKQQFFTNISHEIRTPVTLILSSINRLFDKENLKESKQIKAAHTVRRNSNLLLRLVNELLDVRKLETNDIELNISKNDIIPFVKEIYFSFSEIAVDRNIDYHFKTEINNSSLYFDKNQLEKVVFNLISNAFKFTNDGGEIAIKIDETQNEIILEVEDSGIGLSKEDQQKIFNRFYQVKHKHTENNRGFGLGLSIVQDVVKLHKGFIKLKSKLKLGTTFTVTLLKGENHFKNSPNINLPLNIEESAVYQLNKKIAHKNKTQETILIVEDNIEIQEFLKEFFETENYNVIQGFNGVEGLKMVTKNFPDLIISDVMMPKMDGIEFTKKVKSNSTTSHIPIIILSAKTAVEDKTIGFDLGADDYVTKPFDEELLKIRVKNLLQSRKNLKQKFKDSPGLNPKEVSINSKEQLFLEKLYKCLEENLEANNLKSDIISVQMNMSHSSLYKKIKSLTGLTYVEFIRDYRLSIAKQLIQELGYSVTDACYKVGYSDRKYFSKLFKNKFKENPSYFLKS